MVSYDKLIVFNIYIHVGSISSKTIAKVSILRKLSIGEVFARN